MDDVEEEAVESELDVDVDEDCWDCRVAMRLCRNCCNAAAESVESELEVEDVELVDVVADEDAVLPSVLLVEPVPEMDCNASISAPIRPPPGGGGGGGVLLLTELALVADVLPSTDVAEDVDCVWYKDGSHCENKLFREVTLIIAPGQINCCCNPQSNISAKPRRQRSGDGVKLGKEPSRFAGQVSPNAAFATICNTACRVRLTGDTRLPARVCRRQKRSSASLTSARPGIG